LVQRRAIELGDLAAVLMETFEGVRFGEATAVLVVTNKDRAPRAILDPPVARGEVPVLHFEYGNTGIRMQEDEVGPESVQVRLKIDLPLACEVVVEELEDESLPGLEWCSEAIELRDRR
jgi:hypothetical protein